MVDDTMKIFSWFNVVALWLSWREYERTAKENAKATAINIERLLAMGDVLNDSIGRVIHDTKRLSSKNITRTK